MDRLHIAEDRSACLSLRPAACGRKSRWPRLEPARHDAPSPAVFSEGRCSIAMATCRERTCDPPTPPLLSCLPCQRFLHPPPADVTCDLRSCTVHKSSPTGRCRVCHPAHPLWLARRAPTGTRGFGGMIWKLWRFGQRQLLEARETRACALPSSTPLPRLSPHIPTCTLSRSTVLPGNPSVNSCDFTCAHRR